MKKKDLIGSVAEKAGLSREQAEAAVKATFTTIEEALSQGEKVLLTGFGCFETRDREARSSKNPRTGEIVKIEAGKVPVFKASQLLKDKVL